MTSEDVSLRPACDADAEDLASLRVEAMRESLEKVGRFDPVRARTRFLSSFSAVHTRHIMGGGRQVGVVVIRPEADALKERRSNGFYIRHGFKPLARGEWDNYYVWHVASGA